LKQFKLLKLTVLGSEFQTFIMRSHKTTNEWFIETACICVYSN